MNFNETLVMIMVYRIVENIVLTIIKGATK